MLQSALLFCWKSLLPNREPVTAKTSLLNGIADFIVMSVDIKIHQYIPDLTFFKEFDPARLESSVSEHECVCEWVNVAQI